MDKTYTGMIIMHEARPRSKRLQGAGVVSLQRSESDPDLNEYLKKTQANALYHPCGGSLDMPFSVDGITFSDHEQPGPCDLEVIVVDNVRYLHTRLPFYSDCSIDSGGIGNDDGDGSGGASALSELDDILLSNPSPGQILTFNGTNWINDAAPDPGVTSLAGRTGVVTIGQLRSDLGLMAAAYLGAAQSISASETGLVSGSLLTAVLGDAFGSANTVKDFVNSSIATATATFRGTFSSLVALQAASGDSNDYAFLNGTDELGNAYYDRYKYVQGSGWVFEYRLNNSSFTAAQWSAVNSGITASKVTKLDGIAFGAQENVIETVEVNGVALEPTLKTVSITVPTKLSDLTNDGFVTIDTEQTIAGKKTFTQTITATWGVLMPSAAALFYTYNGEAKNVMCINEDVQTLLYGYDTRSLLHTNLYGKTVNLYTNNGTCALAVDDSNISLNRNFLPKGDNSSDLGSTTNRWSHIYWASYRNLYDEFGAVLTNWGRDGILINGGDSAANSRRQVNICGYPINFTYGYRDNLICLIDGDGIKSAVNGNVSTGAGSNLGGPNNHWRNLYARRWYPYGNSGPYIEFDSNDNSFKVAGNMYVTGFLTGGATGENDVQSLISYSLIPTSSGAYDLGSQAYKYGTLFANRIGSESARVSEIYTGAINANSINITATTRNTIASAMKASVCDLTSVRNTNGLIDREVNPEFYDEYFMSETAILSGAISLLTDENDLNLYRIVGIEYTSATNYTLYLGWRFRLIRYGNYLYMYNSWS